MKAFLTGIAFAVGMVLTTQAFASDNTSQCPHTTWKNGHYVCGDMRNDM
jgi:hypothetical protein